MNKKEVLDYLRTIRCEIYQLDSDKESWEEQGIFESKKKEYKRRRKEINKKLDEVEYRLIPKL